MPTPQKPKRNTWNERQAAKVVTRSAAAKDKRQGNRMTPEQQVKTPASRQESPAPRSTHKARLAIRWRWVVLGFGAGSFIGLLLSPLPKELDVLYVFLYMCIAIIVHWALRERQRNANSASLVPKGDWQPPYAQPSETQQTSVIAQSSSGTQLESPTGPDSPDVTRPISVAKPRFYRRFSFRLFAAVLLAIGGLRCYQWTLTDWNKTVAWVVDCFILLIALIWARAVNLKDVDRTPEPWQLRLKRPIKGNQRISDHDLDRLSFNFEEKEHVILYASRDSPIHLFRRIWFPLILLALLIYVQVLMHMHGFTLEPAVQTVVIWLILGLVFLDWYLSLKWRYWAFVITNGFIRLVRVPPKWFPWMEDVNRHLDLAEVKSVQEDATGPGGVGGWGNILIGTYMQKEEDSYFQKIRWMKEYKKGVKIISENAPNTDVKLLNIATQQLNAQLQANSLLEKNLNDRSRRPDHPSSKRYDRRARRRNV